jgi:hypothetical protein
MTLVYLQDGFGSGGGEFGEIWFLLFVWSFWFNLVSDLDLKMKSEMSEFLYSAFRNPQSKICNPKYSYLLPLPKRTTWMVFRKMRISRRRDIF